MKIKLRFPCRSITVFFSCIFALGAAHAASLTWDGSANGYWTNPANWNPGFRPTNGDALFFPAGPTQLLATNTGLSGAAINLRSLTINGSNYVLVAHTPLVLTNGLTNVVAAVNVTNTIRAHLVARSNATWVTSTKSVLILSSNLNFTNVTLTLSNAGKIEINGALNGGAASTLNKTDGGTLELNGAAVMTQLNVQDGTLQMDGSYTGGLAISNGATLSGTGAVVSFTCAGTVSPGGSGGGGAGVFTAAGTTTFLPGSTLRFTLNGLVPGTDYDQLKSSSPLLSGASLVLLPGFSPLVGNTFIIVTNTGGGTGTPFSGLPEGATQTVNNIQFRISYVGGDGNDVTLTVAGYAATGLTRTWDGGGATNLWSNPTNWVGDVAPNNGDDLVFPNGALRRTNVNDFAAGFTINSISIVDGGYKMTGGNAQRLLAGISAAPTNGPITVDMPLVLGQAQTFSQEGPNTFSVAAAVDLGASLLTISNQGPVSWAVQAVLSGTGGLVKTGAGELVFFATNTFSGPVTVAQGTLRVRRATGLGNTASGTTVEEGATLKLDSIIDTVLTEPLSVAGTLSSFSGTNRIQAAVTLTGTNVTMSAANNAALVLDAPVTEAQPGTHVTVQGSRVVFNGTNNYSRTINFASRCIINGSQPGNAVVLAGGTLGGNGVVGTMTPDLSAASVAPGESPGLLTSSNLLWTTFVTYRVEIAGTAPGTGYDQLAVHGTITNNGAGLEITNLALVPRGTILTIIDNDGVDAVVGTFFGMGEGSFVTNNGAIYRLSYVGGDGNDVTLTHLVFPTGVTATWSGLGTNGLWSNPSNWVGVVVPQPGDTLAFPDTAPRNFATNDFASFTADQILFTGSNLPIRYTLGGNLVELFGGMQAGVQNGQTHQFFCPLRLLAAQTFNGGTNSGMNFQAQVDNNGFLLTTTGGNLALLTFAGPIVGAGGLTHAAPATTTMTLSGTNTFTGPCTVASGLLHTLNGSALGAASGAVFVGSGAQLLFDSSFSLTKSFLSVTGTVVAVQTNTINAEVRLPAAFGTFNLSTPARLIVAGPVTGAAQLLKTGTGVVELLGTNTHAGGTQIGSGTLLVHGSALVGNISILNSATLGGTGTVANVTMSNIAPPPRVAPGASPGLLTASNVTLNAASEFIVELNGIVAGAGYDQLAVRGEINLASAALVLAPGFTPAFGDVFRIIDNDGADAVLGTFAGLPEGTTFTTNGLAFRVSYTGGSGNDVTLTRQFLASGVTRVWDGGGANNSWTNRTNWVGDIAPVEGDALFFPAGAARLNNVNDFPALTAFDALTCGGAYTLGGAAVMLNGGLRVTNSVGTTLNLAVQLNASQTALVSNGASLTFGGAINLGPHTLTFAGAGTHLVNGVISGAGGVIQGGSGTLILSATNTYAGLTEVQTGNVVAFTDAALGGVSVGTTIFPAGRIQLGSGRVFAEPFVVEGILYNPSATNTLTGPIVLAGNNAALLQVDAGELRVDGALSGSGFTKNGAGRLLLNANNTHTNTTTISGGTLLVNGAQPSSPVTLSSFANSVLGGTGTVGTVTANVGTISPGASPGTLTVVGNFSAGFGTTNFFEINGPTPGSGHDQLVINGDVFLNGSVLRLAFGYTPAFGDSFLLIQNNGGNPVGGTFAGLPEGSTITNGAVVARLTYIGGTGNDVVLTRIAVPTGVTRVWDGGGADNLWSNPFNWAGDVLPQQGDDVVLPGPVLKAPLFDAGTNVAYNTLLLGCAYNLNAAAGNSLRLISALTTTNQTGLINLFVPVALQNNQVWTITHPGAQLIQRGPVDLSFATLTHGGAGDLSFTARVTGAGGLSGNSSGILTLSGTNDFTGTVTVNSGTLNVQSSSALGSTLAPTFIGTAGRLSMNLPNGGAIEEPVTLAGRVDVVLGVTNIWNGPVTLAGTQTAFDTLNSGTLVVNGPLSGGGWQTLGIGSLVLNSPTGFTGPFRVGGGARVFVNGDHSAVSFTLTNTGILSGTGTVGQISATCAGCEVNPGSRATPGVLHSSGVTLASGATLRARINGLADYDQLDVTGALTLTGASLVVTSGFNPDPGVSFTIINNDGADPVTGTFNGLPSGALVMSGAVRYQISYTGGDGNDVTLTRVVGAPPSTIQPLTFNNGVPVLNGVGLPGVPYVLEATADLNVPIPWQPILTNTTDGAGVYQFLDHDGTNFPMRFYRVRSP